MGPNCRIVYDKFHILQHANAAVNELRRAEFFRIGDRILVYYRKSLIRELDFCDRQPVKDVLATMCKPCLGT